MNAALLIAGLVAVAALLAWLVSRGYFSAGKAEGKLSAIEKGKEREKKADQVGGESLGTARSWYDRMLDRLRGVGS